MTLHWDSSTTWFALQTKYNTCTQDIYILDGSDTEPVWGEEGWSVPVCWSIGIEASFTMNHG